MGPIYGPNHAVVPIGVAKQGVLEEFRIAFGPWFAAFLVEVECTPEGINQPLGTCRRKRCAAATAGMHQSYPHNQRPNHPERQPYGNYGLFQKIGTRCGTAKRMPPTLPKANPALQDPRPMTCW